MTNPKELKRLGQLTDMVLQLRLADLRNAALRREECLACLEAIADSPPTATGLDGVAPDLARLTYQRWVDNRREELNRQLARKTAEWLEAFDSAKASFGKDQALRQIAGRRPQR